ncbi:ribosome-associated protein [Palleronia aestuarii]|uniref:Ribosomal silencing factor RsfS n=1 Tax=Palleronia aestuarii TaxID=568105 RepID=A0A2W7NEN1_9RHOB|nr:ribosome silencing factor [Palleronia aestuarii]PZX18891.1 ribosome-associated protein [Palleronia aestuarii]
MKEDDVLSLIQIATAGTVAEGPGSALTAPDRSLTSEELLQLILKSLDDDQAVDVVQIDLRGKTQMADYMVICSGRSSRQVGAICEKLVDRLKRDHAHSSKIEGKDGGDWVLIDTGDVIVHVFRPEVRDFYQLEKMWSTPEQTASRL